MYHTNPEYRADIDGLRAISVLGVVIFHAFPNLISGGFIGVDVFFVISGYLISLIICKDLNNNSFNLTNFLSHRIRRIFPALIIVLISCYLFGWLTLLPSEFKLLGKYIASGATFTSNIISFLESGYFNKASEAKPLLHLWSLAIEGQFYIFFPFFLWISYKRKLNTPIITTVILVFSLILCIYGARNNQNLNFYLPQSRLWEFLSGTLLAWLSINNRSLISKIKLNKSRSLTLISRNIAGNIRLFQNTLSIFGLGLLLFGLWSINKNDYFPSELTLIPVIASIFIIAAGPESLINRTILSNRVLVFIGLISFPLYLWHWPLFSYMRIIGGAPPSENSRVVAIFFSFLIAWLTFILIERPFRSKKNNSSKVTLLLASIFIVGFLGYDTYIQGGYFFRKVAKVNAVLGSDFDGGTLGNTINECGIKEKSIQNLFRMCARDKRGNVRFALMGDSKAEAIFGGLIRTSKNDGRWLIIGGSNNNGAPTPLLRSDFDESHLLTNYAIEAIVNNKDIDIVVLVTALRALFNISDGIKAGDFATYDYNYLKKLNATTRADDVYLELNRVVERFIKKNKKVVLVIDNPALPNPEDCANRRTAITFINSIFERNNKDCVASLNKFNEQIKIYREIFLKIKMSHPGHVEIFDATNIYCDTTSQTCSAVKNGRLMYAYTDHISDYAAGLVGKSLNNFLDEK
jgi:peptidoglycan/LPS O-acetylase OafA/YrhL